MKNPVSRLNGSGVTLIALLLVALVLRLVIVFRSGQRLVLLKD